MTMLADLRLQAQQAADRVNASTVTNAEWNGYINSGAGELYGTLTATYEDYNVKPYSFTLAGGQAGNTLQVGPGTGLPDFDKIRSLSSIANAMGSQTTYVPALRCDSFLEFDQLSAPNLATYYGLFLQVKYMLYGNTLEVRPASSAGGTYLMRYLPAFTKLVNDTDMIDGTWMATNGIDEFIVLHAAAKALIKEESLDTATVLLQQKAAIGERVLKQFAQRDDNQPGRIMDTKRARAGFGGWWGSR